MKKLTSPEIAEYASLSGSALGTIVAVTSGQVAYAAIPLTVALSLNLINRNRVQQQTHQYTTEAIAKAYQVVQSLHQQVQTLPNQNTILQLKEQLNVLNRRFDTLPVPPEVDLTEIEAEIAQMQGQLEVLNQQFNVRPEKQAIQQLESTNVQFKAQLNALTVRLDTLPPPPKVDLTGVEAAIALLTDQLDTLHQQFKARPETQAVERLSAQLNVITTRLDHLPIAPEVDLTGIEAAIALLTEQLHTLHQLFNTRPETQAIEHLESVSAQLRVQLNALIQRFEALPTPSKMDLSGVQSVIAHIKSQLNLLYQQFNARPEKQAIQYLEGAIAQLTTQLNVITERLDHLPTPPEVDLSGLENGIAQLDGQLNALNQQFNTRPETEAIERLERESNHLRSQLNAITVRFDHLPVPPEIDLCKVENAIALLTEQLDTLTLRFDNLHIPPEVDLTGVKDAIFTLQERLVPLGSIPDQIVQLQTDLQSLQGQVGHLQSDTVNLTRVEELKKEIERLRHKFQIVSTLNVEMGDLKRRLELLDQLSGILQQLEVLPGFKEAIAALRMLSGNWHR